MLSETCRELNNWFDDDGKGGKRRIFGTFTVSDGTMTVEGAQEGQYIRICDSVFNDGVYQYPLSGMTDETFDGAVWLMSVPQELVDADKAFDEWKEKNSDALTGPFQSESYGGYSYSRISTSDGSGSVSIADSPFWATIKKWRKLPA